MKGMNYLVEKKTIHIADHHNGFKVGFDVPLSTVFQRLTWVIPSLLYIGPFPLYMIQHIVLPTSEESHLCQPDPLKIHLESKWARKRKIVGICCLRNLKIQRGDGTGRSMNKPRKPGLIRRVSSPASIISSGPLRLNMLAE
jgi:hypothetical protein